MTATPSISQLAFGLFMLCCIPSIVVAQVQGESGQVLDNTFQFADGIYLSAHSLLTNTPEVSWGGKPTVFANPQTEVVKADYWILGTGDTLLATQAFALAISGKPFLRIPEIDSPLEAFVPLKVRGRICYFSYADTRKQTLEVTAYNPLTGLPFRRGTVVNEEEAEVHGMYHFPTGGRAPLTKDNLLTWVADDASLVKAILDLADDNRQLDKLIKSIKIYDDRHPFLMPAD